ncbi:capsular polysaccharide biosynthesis protein [Tepidicaulis marinus]|uniref:Capsular polysaccharide biosynthesis protein n=1 Tax=Tepidicaulis marinus TaxID=1333998 RepID=A0A081B7E4_9HYPH|nr:nucleoside-diphosphate sugar epimerase/dehydratase [Tepidicaulis marinus]GAK43962.1 capsular polysaccharide biosynthesis protein [Tepidicaulis marinus]
MVISHRFRNAVILAIDIFLAALSVPISLALRLGVDGVQQRFDLTVLATGIFIGIAAVSVFFSRHGRIAWRWVSVDDAILLARTAVFINLVFLAVLFLTTRLDGFPRSFIGINILCLSGLFIGSRLVFRLWHERQPGFAKGAPKGQRLNVLLVGVTDEAEAFIRKMSRSSNAPYHVSGLINADKERPVGSRIRGVKVLGGSEEIAKIVRRLRSQGEHIGHLILSDPALKGEPVKKLLELTEEEGIRLSRLPEMSQLQLADSNRIAVQPINVEDLLSRPQARLDRKAMAALLTSKRVLVTGAGGSIGSELVRQIAAFTPSQLTLVDASEFNLFEIDGEMARTFPGIERNARLVNVRDRQALFDMFEREKPEIVFHAAALKHVPLLESQPAEAVLTNVMGTRNVADACIAHHIQMMVMVSTDKAVQPVSVMGASKRIAETYCQTQDIRGREQGGTRFVTVRFGNVLGSAGSVVPLFQRQLEQGGPLTVTDPRMTRYFMTIREAVELVLQASTMRDTALEEGGGIVVLDMGEPVNILDMARQMIRLAGLQPGKDVEITFTGLRPGERLYEILFQHQEALINSSHEAIMLARPRVPDEAFVGKMLDSLIEAASASDHERTRELLERILPDFATRADRLEDQEASSAFPMREDPSA